MIAQGIAARYALRQASSEKAKNYGKMFNYWGEIAQKVIDEGEIGKARL